MHPLTLALPRMSKCSGNDLVAPVPRHPDPLKPLRSLVDQIFIFTYEFSVIEKCFLRCVAINSCFLLYLSGG